MDMKFFLLLAVGLSVTAAETSHYHSSLGGLRSCQKSSGGYAVSSEPGVYRHEYSTQYVPASSSSTRVIESQPVQYYSSSSHNSRPVIYESSSSSHVRRPVIYESSRPVVYESSRPVVYESSRPVIYESSSSSSSHNSRPVIYESNNAVPASRTYTTYTQYESPAVSQTYSSPQVYREYYTSRGSGDSGSTQYEYPAATNVRYSSGGCTRCGKKKK